MVLLRENIIPVLGVAHPVYHRVFRTDGAILPAADGKAQQVDDHPVAQIQHLVAGGLV